MANLDDLLMASTLRWLYIDFNSYFASVEQQLRPELRGKPIAIVAVETDSTCAIAASYEAKAYGVRTGTPIYKAKQICPGLICVLARHEHYVDFHHRIQEEVNRHIPITAICSIDEVACRLMRNETSIERATEIACSIKRGLAERIGEYVRCSVGIAPNRYLAKVATELHKPDGLTLLQMHDLPTRLLSLKLRGLPGIGYNMEARLLRAGIGDMRALWQLDPKHMRKIWGSIWGEKMWYLLRGVELPEESTTRSSVGHSHVMAPELRPPEKARYVARRLTIKAASRMRRLGYYASALTVAVRVENGPRLAAEARCYRAQDTFTFLDMLDRLWENLLRGMAKMRLKKVSILLHSLTAVDALQPELFDGFSIRQQQNRDKAERVSRAMDILNYRYGRDTVSLGMLPSQGRSFSGSKIAFTRIPDVEEFLE